jgi:uncharacterized membrane protein
MKKISIVIAALFVLLPLSAFAQAAQARPVSPAQPTTPDTSETMKAKVLDVISQGTRIIPGTTTSTKYQTITVQIIDGSEKDAVITVDNDHEALSKGEIFYLIHTTNGADGTDYYSVSEPYRLPVLIFIAILFVVLIFLFGGMQGIRGLVSLAGSLVLITFVLLPGILHGFSPVLVSLGVSALIIIVGSYITHGFNKTTTSAVVGMTLTVLVTGIFAAIAIHMAHLTGFNNEEAVYLNFDTSGSIDFVGLLFGGILIGLLGVLYDIAISQAIAVEELHTVAPHLSKGKIFKRALRIGREHIGALVNTLAIAYVGVSLPLLLLFVQSSQASLGFTVNSELFATEIIRTLIGSIGLVIAVPITTGIAVWILMKVTHGGAGAFSDEKEKEEGVLGHGGHRH